MAAESVDPAGRRWTKPMRSASAPSNSAAGEHEVPRMARPSPTMRGRPDGAAVDQRDAPAALQAAELRCVAGHPDVAPGGQPSAAGDAPALDGGDDRLRQRHAGGAHGPAVAEAGQVGEVRTGAERGVVAGEDRDLGGGIGVEGEELAVQPLRGSELTALRRPDGSMRTTRTPRRDAARRWAVGFSRLNLRTSRRR